MKVSSQAVRKILWILLSLFLLMNLSAIFHAYRFTHFDPSQEETTERPDQLSFWEKVEVLFLGIKNPRPVNTKKPKGKYKTITLDDKSPALESWSIPSQEGSRGIVLMFHGYKASKSSLLDKSKVLREMGYRTVLVDLMGSGGSEGNTTTLGHFEAQQVQRCSEHWEEKEDGPIYLFGSSMGAVAIMKALKDHSMDPQGIILESPYGSLHRTISDRFHNMNVPAFPFAGLLTFWGGTLNGFWAFDLRPIDYAKEIATPTLLLYGVKDERVNRRSIDRIHENLLGSKELVIFSSSGHGDFLKEERNEWKRALSDLLTRSHPNPRSSE